MNPEIKERWVKELRSGNYKQTKDCLKDDDGYCCLGVLTDLAIQDGVIDPWKVSSDTERSVYFIPSVDEDNPEETWDEESVLPPKVRDWAGLDLKNPHVRLSESISSVPISDPNDNGYTFEQIADIIEEQF